MTSEVVLMNRRAIALAADSASTITRWVRGERKSRYFKGTNKIFQLSHSAPVGMMINGAGSLQGVPWETLVKTFRDSYLKQDFDKLSEYPTALLSWIEGNREAFPTTFLHEQFLAEVLEGAGKIVFGAFRDIPETLQKAKRNKELVSQFKRRKAAVSAAPMLGNAVPEDIAAAISSHADAAARSIENAGYLAPLAQVIGFHEVAVAAITGIFKEGHSTLDVTGLVFGGYGSKEYFPCVEAFECYGNVLGKLLYERKHDDCRCISQENVSEIVPFAKSEMIYTFIAGTSIAGMIAIDKIARESLDVFHKQLVDNNKIIPGSDASSERKAAHTHFKDSISEYYRTNHMSKLRSVVGMLPLPELAELSETLVHIESMKERVTTDEESVSGPIDVALISKNDGFIWIKRKHYFDGKLNPRYASRTQAIKEV